ncbi:isocitrate/isopropylmalate dehydrogenase family protein [Candidatus Bathyarchaeota archaeon]|nr:isocitrate/isopropylmalate dehydrogenase family protein [Candidatus Bathyarchaeota archaeon]
MKYTISLIRGDGIGPEQSEATTKVLEAVQRNSGVQLDFMEAEAGDACFAEKGVALPKKTIKIIESSDACLKGPVGETAADVIVRLRIMFDLYANIRPVKSYPNVPVLKPDLDFVIVRENTEGVYKGLELNIDQDTALCLRIITRRNSERIARYAFNIAEKREKKHLVTAVHKSNVMKKTCGLFAETCRKVAKEHPNVSLNELYVDAAAMQLIKNPGQFDVIVTTNMFGDILSDEASMLVGGLGMAPGANIGEDFALFEPVHGSAPKYAGKQVANPCSMILASAMMLDWLGHKHSDEECLSASRAIDEAVADTLRAGVLTRDLGGGAKTIEFGEAVAKRLKQIDE